MINLLDKTTLRCAEICGWLLVVLMVFLLADIFFRTAGYPLIGVAELSMFVMLTTVYLGMANCEMHNGHVKVEFFVERLPDRRRRSFALFTGFLNCVTLAICTYAMTVNAYDSYVEDEAMAGLVPYQVWPVKAVMAFGIALYFLQSLRRFIETVRNKPTDTSQGAGA